MDLKIIISTFLGPKWHSPSARCHFTGPTKSRLPGPYPLPHAFVMDAALIKALRTGPYKSLAHKQLFLNYNRYRYIFISLLAKYRLFSFFIKNILLHHFYGTQFASKCFMLRNVIEKLNNPPLVHMQCLEERQRSMKQGNPPTVCLLKGYKSSPR